MLFAYSIFLVYQFHPLVPDVAEGGMYNGPECYLVMLSFPIVFFVVVVVVVVFLIF